MGSSGWVDSKLPVFKIDNSGGGIRDISAQVTEIDGLMGARRMDEVTALGDSGMRYNPGIEDVTIRVTGLVDGSSSGASRILRYHRKASAAFSFEYGPEGQTTGTATVDGDVKIIGECWCSELVFPSRVGNIQTFTATLPVDNVITVDEAGDWTAEA